MNHPGRKLALAACIVVGFSTSAHTALAQSNTNVTLYGIVDVGTEYIDGAAAAGRAVSLTRVSSSSQIASRWGLRGSENLGGGWKAIFNLESGFSPDTGALLQGGRIFGRTAIVGLEGGLGSLMLGRQRNLIFDANLIYDPMGYGSYGNTATDYIFFVQRADNAIKYNYKQGGLSGALFYSLGRDALAGTPAGSQSEVPGNSRIGRQLGAGANYVAGPLSVGLAYDQQAGTTAALAHESDSRLYLAAKYTVDATTLYAGVMRRNNDVAAPDTEWDLYWIGIKRPLAGKWGIKAALSHTSLKDSPNTANLLAASIYYEFSKRTEWYVNLAYANNRGKSTQGTTQSSPTLPGENQKAIVSGIVHRF
jgi:predicted porin